MSPNRYVPKKFFQFANILVVDFPEYTNKQAQCYLGLTLEQFGLVYKYNLNEVVHPDDFPDVQKAWTETFNNAVSLTAEFRLKRASDDTYRWMLMRCVPGTFCSRCVLVSNFWCSCGYRRKYFDRVND